MSAIAMTRRFGLAAAAAVMLAGCSVLDLDGYDDERERLEANRAAWEAQGIDSYEFVLRRLCFCAGGTNPALVRVRNGERLSVTDTATGEPIDEQLVEYYLTVPELFDFIADAIDRKAHRIDVTYDRTFGFPSSISIDYLENAIDEEMAFEAKNLQPER